MIHSTCQRKATALQSEEFIDYTRRRYSCGHCGVRFSTYEREDVPEKDENKDLIRTAIQLLQSALE